MNKLSAVCLCLLIFASLAGSHANVSATSSAPPTAPFRYYPETGHNLGGAFLEFYDANGGVAVFGLPLTEAFSDTIAGIPVQYFERVRMEWHADRPAAEAVVLSPLGSLMTSDRSEPAFDPQVYTQVVKDAIVREDGTNSFSVQRKPAAFEPFASFWQAHGAEQLFGEAISAPVLEAIEGSYLLAQYYEFARLEYHPGPSGQSGNILVGMLGREMLENHPNGSHLSTPSPPIVELAAATTPFYSATSAEGLNIMLAANRLDGSVVQPDEVVSFLNDVGPLTETAGYVSGLGILSGDLQPVLAGGICQVSSALYEAALYAGLEIVERHAHTYLLSFFAHQPGVEAAVYITDDLREDFRWRNTLNTPIYIDTSIDYTNAQVRVSLWGIDDGRSVLVGAPQILRTYSLPVERIEDANLQPDEEIEERAAIIGMETIVWREVRDAQDTVLLSESIVTSYNPLGGIVRHGPEATPTPEATPEPMPEPTTRDMAPRPDPTALPVEVDQPTPAPGAEADSVVE